MIWTQNKPTKESRLQPLWISSIMHEIQWQVISRETMQQRFWPQAVFVIFHLSAKSDSLKIFSPGFFSAETILAPCKHQTARNQSAFNIFQVLHWTGYLLTPEPQKIKNMHTEARSCSSSTLASHLKIKRDWSSTTLMFCAWEPHLGLSLSSHFMGREWKITSHFGLTWITATVSAEAAKKGFPTLFPQCLWTA